MLVKRLPSHRGQDGQGLGVDWAGGQLGDEVGEDGPGLDSHDLPQTVQGVLVHVGVPELLQHCGRMSSKALTFTFNVKHFIRNVYLEPGGTTLRSPNVTACLSLCWDRGPPDNATVQLQDSL